MHAIREPKLLWRSVPTPVRQRTVDLLGAPVARAVRSWGGYAPSATFRLALADGRRAFFKGINAASNDHMRKALATEEQVYRELGDLISPWSPVLLGSFRYQDWHVLLLEYLGPQTAPPWRDSDLRAVACGLAELHAATLGRELPDWIPRGRHAEFASTWRQVAAEDGLGRLCALAGPHAHQVETWFSSSLPVLGLSAESLADAPEPYSLLHFDVRSDNLRIVDGQLRLFDWNWASTGAPEIDVAAFAQSVTVEGGGTPEEVIGLYEAVLPTREDVLTAAVSAIAGFFLAGFWRPEIPGLPRLRAFQRQQAVVTLRWAARRLSLPEPEWLGRLGVWA